MVAMEQLKKRLSPLMCDLNSRAPDTSDMSIDMTASYKVSDEGTLNLQSQTRGDFAINSEGLQFQRVVSTRGDDKDAEGTSREYNYRIASKDMCLFGAIGFGASSVVRKAVHIPTHRIVALKKINVFEKDKRSLLMNEIKLLCEAPNARGLVEFYGAFYSPDSGQISIALEYMDGGSLADVVREAKIIPEPTLSVITRKVLHGLCYLHQSRHLVHRDIKPANLLMNLSGEPKITDFGISAGLDNSIAMCATFVGTVTYMSPERINNQQYSYPADIWSLGLTLLECGTGEFPYNANKGPVTLMLQVMEDPSPSPPADRFSPEFRSFVDACLLKDSRARPTAEQLLQHPFIRKYENMDVDLPSFIHSVFDPCERLKDLSDMLTIHYYMLFDGPNCSWKHMESFYRSSSTLVFANQRNEGATRIFTLLTQVRNQLAGPRPGERLVHTVEFLDCRPDGRYGLQVRVIGSLVAGTHFIPAGDGAQVEGVGRPYQQGPPRPEHKLGSFWELITFESGELQGSYWISKQELAIKKLPR
eukprot:SM000034S12689  [mRNA]  locus=s34:188028:191701:+ [translate_table: standard]